MSTFKYYNASNLFATAGLNWLTCAPNAMLVGPGYSPLPTDQNVSDIPPSAIIVRDIALTSLAVSKGVCKGNIPQIDALLSSITAVAVVLYSKQSTDAASPLIYYSSDGFGFPFLPSGFNYVIGYDQANGGWFQA